MILGGLSAGTFPDKALAENHRVCVTWTWLAGESGYTDASPRPDAVEVGGDLGDDTGALEPDWENFGETEGFDAEETYGRRDEPDTFTARHMLARVRSTAGATLWGWAPLLDGDQNEDEDGCTGIFDTNESMVALEWVSWALDGDHIVALECDAVFGDCGLRGDTAMLTVESGTTDIEYAPDSPPITPPATIAMLWAMTYAEHRRSYWDDMIIYAAHWNENVNLPFAVTNLAIANRPTVNMRSGAELRKFTVAHEYGHIQTLLPLWSIWAEVASLVDYCAPSSCAGELSVNQHGLDSVEWQSAAAIEGFANFYSMAVWNETTGDGVFATPGEQLWEITAYKSTDTHTNSAGTFESLLDYKTTDSCMMADPQPCPSCSCQMGQWSGCDCDGMAIELDWSFYLWDLLGGSPALDIDTVMELLSVSYTDDDDWPEPGETDWWSEFESDAQAQFMMMSEQARISDEAEDRGIDQ